MTEDADGEGNAFVVTPVSKRQKRSCAKAMPVSGKLQLKGTDINPSLGEVSHIVNVLPASASAALLRGTETVSCFTF